ncbi:MAG: response regulator [Saprospiraceae bacterium]
MPHAVLIFEDDPRLRESLQLLLDDAQRFSVVGAYENCIHAAQIAIDVQPDLVLMDIEMPGISGIDGVRAIKSVHPAAKIVMFTVFEDDSKIFECMCAGADGYLLKSIDPAQLSAALLQAMEGISPVSPQVASRIFQFFRTQQQPNNSYTLSKREREVLQYLVEGYSYKMIAAACYISIDTVKKHLKNIYAKLHVTCGNEAVAKAIKNRIV